MQATMTFTAAASAYIKKMVEKEQGAGFRLSIKRTGCSGYAYLPTIVTKVNPKDVMFEIDYGVKIYVDAVWFELLKGLKVDYCEEDKAGLKQKRLVFTNPNESNRCGCGESFNISDHDLKSEQ